MSMTKDTKGNCIFVAGKSYRPKSFINPVWPTVASSKCIAVEPFMIGRDDGSEEVIESGKGIFTNGNDTRSYVATNQFEEVKE